MASVEQITAAVTEYARAMTAGDSAAVVDLFTDDALVRDPVDSEELRGRAAFEAFFHAAPDVLQSLVVTGPVRISGDGNHAAAPIEARAVLDGNEVVIHAVDVWTFDDAGKFTSMTAYYGPANTAPA